MPWRGCEICVSGSKLIPPTFLSGVSMDKKIKKKLEKANQKVQKLQQQLAGAKQQDDEPGEVARLEKEIAATKAEIAELRAS